MLTYLITRCHGLRTHLLSPTFLETLTKLKDIKDIANSLLVTDYRKEIEELERVDVYTLERVINEKLVKRCEFILDLTAGKIYDFFKAYFRRYEIQNILRILRAKTFTKHVKESLLPLGKLSELDFNELTKKEEIPGEFVGTMYEEITTSLGICEKYKSLLPIEAHLKKIYYRQVLESIPVALLRTKEKIERLIKTEVDFINCFTCMAPFLYGYSKELFRNLLIPYTLKVPISSFEKAIEAESEKEIMALLSPYSSIIELLLKRNEALAHIEALRLIRREVLREAYEESIYFTYVICYLMLCEFEWKDLITIILGKQYGMNSKEILELLISKPAKF